MDLHQIVVWSVKWRISLWWTDHETRGMAEDSSDFSGQKNQLGDHCNELLGFLSCKDGRLLVIGT